MDETITSLADVTKFSLMQDQCRTRMLSAVIVLSALMHSNENSIIPLAYDTVSKDWRASRSDRHRMSH